MDVRAFLEKNCLEISSRQHFIRHRLYVTVMADSFVRNNPKISHLVVMKIARGTHPVSPRVEAQSRDGAERSQLVLRKNMHFTHLPSPKEACPCMARMGLICQS